ncbi:class I SAM-dependent methyltransferase [Paraburkholderia sp. SIMBA_030]|uniref:class I SAM-dependent methyltransferase n=1 Tax=Paraburkholderia sp. SIMBA_030 TaxID=3085773 RepID=UPI00397B1050
MSLFKFTNNWFGAAAKGVWDQLIPQIKPEKILEIGSYEGASACYLIETLAKEQAIEIHCVDTWEGGIEHQAGGTAEADMSSVESRFYHNVRLATRHSSDRVELVVHKGYSDECLSRLIAEGKKGYFDFVYVDGSHQAPDVLCDAILGFKLLKIGGVIAFDDYIWSEDLPSGKDLLRCPKPAIDAFVNLNFRKLRILSAPLYQLYAQKLSD